jgi:hypothetical protein
VDTKNSHEHDSPSGELRHEVRDVSVRPVAWFGVGLLILVLISIALMKGLFVFFAKQEEAQDPKPVGVMIERPKEPPQPRLQTNPVLALKQIVANEKALLSSYGWVDKKTGTVRIPVQKAMELLAERGLPARAANETAKEGAGPLKSRGNGETVKRGDGDSAWQETRSQLP